MGEAPELAEGVKLTRPVADGGVAMAGASGRKWAVKTSGSETGEVPFMFWART